ncbi:hypothetical protein G6F45_013854 [Rhizopus arrhizus]|uniref:Uncharacterized protein n=1 Tax=Rhizopus delemar TaxID=936053 RepID=A0A9P7C1H7_9FUNG|nr:hypothetical protein G6F50_016797 [Rhizopus delemar]KAG1607043.1 hypothetical protein G6F45_013854 [Rhizopus arrhizus]
MDFRADTLVLKYCLRVSDLPDDCLLSLLTSSVPLSLLSRLRQRRIVHDCPPVASSSTSRLSSWLRRYRQERFDAFLQSTSRVLIRACRPCDGAWDGFLVNLVLAPVVLVKQVARTLWSVRWSLPTFGLVFRFHRLAMWATT